MVKRHGISRARVALSLSFSYRRISLSLFRCRKLGIARWPHRKLHSLLEMYKSLAGYYKVGKAFGRLTFFYPTRKKGCCFSLSLELRLLVKYSRKRKRTTGTVRKDDARTMSSTAKQAHEGGADRAERFGAPEKLRVESGAFFWWC